MSIFNPNFLLQSISFLQMANIFHSRASPFLVASQILDFCHSGDHPFQNFFPFKPLLLNFTLTKCCQPECQPDIHARAMHAQVHVHYLVPETPPPPPNYSNKVSSRVSNINSVDLHFHTQASSWGGGGGGV